MKNKKLVHTLFEYNAAQHPEKVAIETCTTHYSYRQVNSITNQLAKLIQEFAVKDDVVATFASQEVVYIFSLLATFKAGAVYLPLDKKYRKNHWATLFETIQPTMVFVEDTELADFEQYNLQFDYTIPTVFVVKLTQEGIQLTNYQDAVELQLHMTATEISNIALPDAHGEDANSIFFSSGSTGRPKAILGCHKSLGHFMNWQTNEFKVTTNDRVGQLVSFSFDASLRDIFLPLINGATLCIPSKETRSDISKLAQWLRTEKISLAHMVPTFFRLILSDDTHTEPFSLRYLFLSGEKLYEKDIANWQQKYGTDTKIVNFYGATESTLIKTFFVADALYETTSSKSLSVGKPISNTAIIIINEKGELCKPEEQGEIYIRTPFLSKGYYKDPKTTAVRFVQNPLKEEKEIVYKTGDYGMYDYDWNTTVLGRTDAMAKLNGVRININAIENTILKNAAIKAIKCSLQTDENQGRLVCFYTADKELNEELFEYSRQELSEYEMPSLFVHLERFPLNANGKTDEKALLENLRKRANTAILETLNPLQQKITLIWQRILKLESVFLHDHFFQIGGNSISAMRLITAYQNELDVSISFADIFEFPFLKSHEEFILKASNSKLTSIPKTTDTQKIPLSSSQRNMWIACQVSGSEVYNMFAYVYMDLKEEAYPFLEKAIQKTIERHESLRTVFNRKDEEIYQRVLSINEFNFSIQNIDFSAENNSEQKALAYVDEDAYIPFDLENGPLIRACRIKIDEKRSLFYYNMHHLISDIWSLEVLIRDVVSFFNYDTGETDTLLPALDIQYKDYVRWQIAQSTTEKYAAHTQFWKKKLAGDIPVLKLPTFQQKTSEISQNGHKLNTCFGQELTEAIKRFSNENSGTLYMFLLASLKTLFYRYTGQKDIIVGTPMASREHADLADQIGLYVNTLPMRTQLDGNSSFQQLFNQIKGNVLEVYQHQTYPFDQVVDDLEVNKNVQNGTLFDVLVVLQNTINIEDIPSVTSDQIEKIVDAGATMSKFDLSFNFLEAKDHIRFELIYNTQVYDALMMSNLMTHYTELIKNICKNSAIAIDELNYITAAEYHEVVYDFNATEKAYPTHETILNLFEKSVQNHPNAIALWFENSSLTYKEVDELSNQFAHYLMDEHHITSGDLVSIKISRSQWVTISVLGILKSSAAYVPIEPSYPEQRIDFMISDSNCKLVLDEVVLETFVHQKDTHSKSEISNKPSPEDLAYIIYTSGSTGTPKGTLIGHHSLNARMHYMIDSYKLSVTDTSFFYRSFSFDGSIEEYVLPLLAGAKCVIAATNIKENLIENILLQIESHGITKLNAPPALLYEMVNYAEEHKVEINISSLRNLVSGGDKLSTYIADKCRKMFPNTVLHNTYGPTECTIDSTHLAIQKEELISNMTIGTPIPNTQIYILDDNGKIVPKGVIGEICVGGVGVSIGYLNRPALNAEKFVSNPFIKNGRIYKTGDLGRWLPNGTIEFKGRKDDQVKVRGYRIELGDIEKVMTSNSAVKAAFITVKTLASGDKNIIAYYTATSEQKTSDLRSYVREQLPFFMIPSFFIHLDEFPLTVNGKIDQKKLPNPESLGLSLHDEYEAPETDTEKKLVKIWETLLDRKKIGVKDDFFELGGHSLKVIRLISEYHKIFEVKISIPELFFQTTIAAHATLIQQTKKETYTNIPKLEEADNYTVSDSQRRLWVLSQFGEGAVAYNMPNSILLEEIHDIHNFEKAIYCVLERHEILRTVFREQPDGTLKQVILQPKEVNFTFNHQDYSGEKDAIKNALSYLQKDAYLPFNLHDGPLLRIKIIQLDTAKFILYYNLHHIICDGWSMNILSRDIMAYYDYFSKQKTLDLPTLPIQYKDYAAWQRSQLQSEEFDTLKKYWLQKLSGTIPVVNLPSAKQRPKLKTYNGQVVHTYLDKVTTREIRSYISENGGTLFMFLVAALKVLIYRYTNQNDIIIGTSVAGREHADLEDQIGCYLNTLALRNQVQNEVSFDAFYQEVKNNLFEAYSHQSYPFDRLVEELKLTRDTSRSALFDILVMLQNTGEAEKMPDINEAEMEQIQQGIQLMVKFDVEFDFSEVGDSIFCQVRYNTDIYDAAIIENFIKHFKNLLKSIVLSSSSTIETISYLSASDTTRLLQTYNQTSVAYHAESTFLDLMMAQVAANPNALAIADAEKSYTYQEVWNRVEKISSYLLTTLGETKEPIVLLLDRNSDMLLILLGILRSGNSYIPIDIDFPTDRIHYIIENSQSNYIITDSNLGIPFTNITAKIIDQTELLTHQTVSHAVANVQPDATAYIIYTSGSTGKPKGVAIGHHSLHNFLRSMQQTPGITKSDRMYSVTTYSFDISILEFLVPLISGASVYISSRLELMDPAKLKASMEHYKPTIMQATPSFYQLLLDSGWEGNRSLRILCGGDILSDRLSKNLLPKVSELWNMYGPTETTIWSTCRQITENDRSNNIGYPIANTQIYILDAQKSVVPEGVVGEVYIGGHGLAKGYYKNSFLTDTRFINHSFSDESSEERLYATGDLGRRMLDGSIEFLGRNDYQVKIRGYRIELGEIEKVVLASPKNIKEAVVLAKESAEEKTLVVYYRATTTIDKKQLKDYLLQKLSSYMVPSYYKQLEHFPLTANGKIDRKALPDITNEDIIKNAYKAPKNELEEAMVQIIKDAMKEEISVVGTTDNFFDLGFNSLSLMQVLNQFNSTLNLQLKPLDLFQYPNIKALVENVLEAENEQEEIFTDISEDMDEILDIFDE